MSAVTVANIDSLPVDRGVAVIVSGEYVAVFRLADGEVVAIDHVEPFSNVPVLARGLVGCANGVPVVASPLHKQRFDLRTGACLDDPAVSVRVWGVEVIDDMVTVAAEPTVGTAGMVGTVEQPSESAA